VRSAGDGPTILLRSVRQGIIVVSIKNGLHFSICFSTYVTSRNAYFYSALAALRSLLNGTDASMMGKISWPWKAFRSLASAWEVLAIGCRVAQAAPGRLAAANREMRIAKRDSETAYFAEFPGSSTIRTKSGNESACIFSITLAR